MKGFDSVPVAGRSGQQRSLELDCLPNPLTEELADLLCLSRSETQQLLGIASDPACWYLGRNAPGFVIRLEHRNPTFLTAHLVWQRPNTQLTPHRHEHPMRVLVLRGAYSDRLGLAKPGDLCRVPAGLANRVHVGADGLVACLAKVRPG